MSWQRILVSTGATVGAPGVLPEHLVGLDAATLADLPAFLAPATIEQLGLADTGFLPVADPPSPPPPAPRVLARIDFIRRFTGPELAAIQASTDPVVKTFLFMLTVIEAVELDNADTQNGVGYMATTTPPLLAAGRPAQILA